MMAQLRIDLQRRGKVETFPRARIEPLGDDIQLPLGARREIRTFGQVLAQ